ncbi:MAG: hypothetical protein R3Y09_06560 [Clostridia bacterium]
MINWSGISVSKVTTWKESANSYLDLFNKLESRGIINRECYNMARMEKGGQNYEEFLQLHEDDWNNDMFDGMPDLTESELKELIQQQDGNAYYQRFEEN